MRASCRLEVTESEARRQGPTLGGCEEPTPRDFWDGDVLLHDIDDILIGSEVGDDDNDDLCRRVCSTDIGSVDSRQVSGVSAGADDGRLVLEHATKTSGFVCEM